MIFDETTTAHHRVARLTFVPWLARFLGEGPFRVESPALPIGNPGALTQETVEGIQFIANRACWRFLARECGWQRVRAIEPNRPDSHSVRRLWEKGAGLPHLTFSTATPDLLLAVFNASRRGEDLSAVRLPDCQQGNGDIILHHLLFRRISSNPKIFGLDQGQNWPQWYPNPLNALLDPEGYREFERNEVAWNRLIADDLAPFLPWMGSHVAHVWNRHCENFWAIGLENRLRWLEAMTVLFSDWQRVAESAGRLDLILFQLEFLACHRGTARTHFNEFHRMTENLPLRHREQLARSWVDFINQVTSLDQAARTVSGVHPVERTGAQRCFLAYWEENVFRETVHELREISRSLRPVIA